MKTNKMRVVLFTLKAAVVVVYLIETTRKLPSPGVQSGIQNSPSIVKYCFVFSRPYQASLVFFFTG